MFYFVLVSTAKWHTKTVKDLVALERKVQGVSQPDAGLSFVVGGCLASDAANRRCNVCSDAAWPCRWQPHSDANRDAKRPFRQLCTESSPRTGQDLCISKCECCATDADVCSQAAAPAQSEDHTNLDSSALVQATSLTA